MNMMNGLSTIMQQKPNIYILPYTFKHYISHDKRTSGVDVAAMTQLKILTELGYNVKFFSPYGDLHKHFEHVDFYNEDLIDIEEIRMHSKANKKDIFETIKKNIITHKTDVILSNHEFTSLYKFLSKLNIPIIYNSHASPGFILDYSFANELHDFVKSGNTLCCVSEFHKNQTELYYKRDRKTWEFSEIIPDFVLSPQFIEFENEILPSDGVVRHISAASKDKKTFLIHELLNDTNIDSEIFTTLNYHGGHKLEDYVSSNLEKYKNRKTFLDIKHDDIMERIRSSTAMFVGLAYFDSFTITSLEALIRGIPLLLSGRNGLHPAQDMIEYKNRKYTYLFKNKQDFLNKYLEFEKLYISDRIEISNSTKHILSRKSYENQIENLIDFSIRKFNKEQFNILEFLK